MGDSKYDRWQFHQVLMPSSVLYVIYWFYPVIHWAQHLSLVEYTVVQRCIVVCNFDSYGKICTYYCVPSHFLHKMSCSKFLDIFGRTHHILYRGF